MYDKKYMPIFYKIASEKVYVTPLHPIIETVSTEPYNRELMEDKVVNKRGVPSEKEVTTSCIGQYERFLVPGKKSFHIEIKHDGLHGKRTQRTKYGIRFKKYENPVEWRDLFETLPR